VPTYGYRTRILERDDPKAAERKREFIPVLLQPVQQSAVCFGMPYKATYKNPVNGIVMMESKKCIGCKTCMAASRIMPGISMKKPVQSTNAISVLISRLSKGEN